MAKDLVLLTGATGYLGYLTLIELVKAGYQVRAAVRSQSKVAKVEAAPSFKALNPSVEWVIVPDMTAGGAYDEAVKGAKYVVHVASPIPTLGDEPIPVDKLEQYFLKTAPRGEITMLESAERSGTVKRIVVTSSVVAIMPFEYYLGTADYSVEFGPDSRIPDVVGPFDFEFQAYSAGKAAALNASESWVEAHKPDFDVISVMPGWIFGRDELVTDVESLRKGSTNSVLANLLLGSKAEVPFNGNAVLGDDVAKVQVLALDPKVEGNQSFTASVDFEWEAAIDILKKSFPQQIADGKLSTEGKQGTLPVKVSSRKTEEVLGFKFSPFEKMVDAVANQYLELSATA
jgi:nucleoside-diphosphate-sugar epimerase